MADYPSRRLSAADAAAFRAARLCALRDFPDAYTSTFAEERAESESYHRRMIEDHLAFGSFDGERLIATAVARRYDMARCRHKCMLSAVFVASGYRRQGIASALLRFAMQGIAREFEQIVIATDTRNEAAIHLYESLGFTPFGVEPHALKEGDRYLDDLWMLKKFA